MAEPKPSASGAQKEKKHHYFTRIALVAVILLQLVIIYLLLAGSNNVSGMLGGVQAKSAPSCDKLLQIFQNSNNTTIIGIGGTGGSGSASGTPGCSVTEAGGRTVIVTRGAGGEGGTNTRTILLFNNQTRTVVVLNGSGQPSGGQDGIPEGTPATTDAQGCYTVTVCPAGSENQTPICPPPTSSCVPNGLFCGDHPNAAPNSTCCAGLSCQNGYCLPPPRTSCQTIGGSCITTADCCSGTPCIGGICQTGQSCKSISEFCASSSECCSGFSCQGGLCQPSYQGTQPTCTDSDNGVNLEVPGITNGTLNGQYGSYEDYCRPTGMSPPYHVYNQIEYSCTGNGSEVRGTAVGCAYGCDGGVCLPQPTVCTDSDGNDILVRGTTSGTNASGSAVNLTDSCDSSSYVIEYTCSNRIVTGTNLFCMYGCLDGACQPPPQQQPQTCTDSDGGIDYNVTGTVTLSPSGLTYTDSCGISIQDMTEYYCLAGNVANATKYCDYKCSDGKCVPPAAPQPQWCTDSDGGINYLVRGTLATSDGASLMDSCVSATSLREYRCFSANSSSFTSAVVTCADVGPSICGNGACGG